MNLDQTLQTVVDQFNQNAVRYGLIGGYAVAIHGYMRTTVDLDFLINRTDLPRVDRILIKMGYEVRYRSENVSQFGSDQELLGEIDFIHAFRAASKRMLKNAIEFKLFTDGPLIKVLKVEDIIGLKVQAIANAPHRKARDLEDIHQLININNTSIDWPMVEEYFNLFQLNELLSDIKRKP